MKKLAIIIAITMLLSCTFCFSACDGNNENEKQLGTFYTVSEVYDNGGISKQDLLSIAYYVKGKQGIEDEKYQFPDDFVPTPKKPETLDEKTISDLEKVYNAHVANESELKSNYKVCIYLGTYGDYIAVLFRETQCSWIQVVCYDGADDVRIMLPDPSYSLILYKKSAS